MTTIQVRANQIGSHAAYAEVAQVFATGTGEISDATAATIAAWWQTSSGAGRLLASFASGCSVEREALLDEITDTRNAEGYHNGRMAPRDRAALDCLSTYVLNHE
jgi:hypothetical protein